MKLMFLSNRYFALCKCRWWRNTSSRTPTLPASWWATNTATCAARQVAICAISSSWGTTSTCSSTSSKCCIIFKIDEFLPSKMFVCVWLFIQSTFVSWTGNRVSVEKRKQKTKTKNLSFRCKMLVKLNSWLWYYSNLTLYNVPSLLVLPPDVHLTIQNVACCFDS